MRDHEKTKEELISELNELRTRNQAPAGAMVDGDDDPLIYKQILDDLPQAVYEFGIDGSITYANAEALRLFGYTADEVMKGLSLEQLHHPDERERVLSNISRIQQGVLPPGQEYKAICKDGSSLPVKLISQPVFRCDEMIGIRGIMIDITAPKQAERDLRKSKDYYQTLFNNTGTAMVIFGDDSIIKSCNDQFTTLSGCSKREIEGKMKWSDFVEGESLQKIRSYHTQRMTDNSDTPIDYEFTFVTQQGQRRTIHVFVQLIPKTRDRVCSLIDITDRKDTEQALRRSEERYELVVKGANDGIWDWDLETDTVYYSPRYKAIIGYEDHEFPNKAEAWKSHVHTDDIDYVIGENMKCVEGKVSQFEVEYRMRHKDGSWRWIHGRGASVANEEGKIYRLAGTHTDITSRKTQEQTTNALYAISKAVSYSSDLQELYSYIHTILSEVIDAENFFICVYDTESDSARFPYWKDSVDTYEAIGNISNPGTPSPTAEIIRTGEKLFITKQTPQSWNMWDELGYIGTPSAAWLGVPLKARDTIIGTMTVQHYEDPYRYSESDVALMEAASEQVALGIERKRSEEALTRLNEKLESKVEERTAKLKHKTEELEALNKRLTELDEVKSALVSSISHELRTPLTSIRGFAKLAGKDFKRFFHPMTTNPLLEQKGSRILSNLSIIESEGERLTRLINDFLDINRIESGNATWNDEAFNPSAIVGMAVSALSGVFSEKKGVDLVADIPETSTLIHADPDKIQQVLTNLLGNAAKFTRKGAVTVSLKDSIDTVTISVQDTGSGIPEDELDSIFEKFHKSHTGDTITHTERGTGLGLAICKEIVTHYGGSIWVESTLGEGSTFSFSISTAPEGNENTC